jgi:hypothetical protein
MRQQRSTCAAEGIAEFFCLHSRSPAPLCLPWLIIKTFHETTEPGPHSPATRSSPHTFTHTQAVFSAASFEPLIISLEKAVSHSSAEVPKAKGCADIPHLQHCDIPPISLRRTQSRASQQTAASVTIEKTAANKKFLLLCFTYPFIHSLYWDLEPLSPQRS